MNKIGVGIVTYNRENQLRRLYNSLPLEIIDSLVIVNDGDQFNVSGLDDALIIHNEKNIGVGKSKNKALKYLLNRAVDYIFLIEDDLYVKDHNVFDKYILAHKISGIHHFNYALHGLLNLNIFGQSKPKLEVIYDNDISISLYQNCVGAFSFFTKTCLQEVGGFDENYLNALEHVDHTFSVIKHGLHPPFWFFADISNSNLYIGDDGWSLKTSVISNSSNFNDFQKKARGYFYYKNGIDIFSIPKCSNDVLIACLKCLNVQNSNIYIKSNRLKFLMDSYIQILKKKLFIFFNS